VLDCGLAEAELGHFAARGIVISDLH